MERIEMCSVIREEFQMYESNIEASAKQAAVFILLGQSNAVGHGVPMEEKDKIKEPLKNVFGLTREQNQSYHNEELVWSGYTSGGMNLGEEQDDTYSVANCLARQWQDEIDSGNKANLPDLYIVQIAIGSEGVTQQYMWYPDRAEKLVPGKLGTVDISLYPFTVHILSLLRESLSKLGITQTFVELHWRGGSQEMCVPIEKLREDLEPIYIQIFGGLEESLGMPANFTIHLLPYVEAAMEYDPSGGRLKSMQFVNDVFEKIAHQRDNYALYDPKSAPHYVPDTREHNLFIEDVVHYNPKTNNWVAQQIMNTFKARRRT